MADPSNEPLANGQDVVELQRAAIAGEIHDSLIPYLFATRMRLESLIARLRESDDAADLLKLNFDSARTELARSELACIEVSKAIETLQAAMTVCRQLTSELYPPELTTSWSDHLFAALDRAGGSPGTRLVVTGDFDSLNSKQADRIAARRIAQEAIRNAVRHGRATTVQVSVKPVDEGRTQLSIRDDGCGFDTALIRNGYGLRIMRSRANLVDATFTVESKLGEPTAVTVTFNR